MSLSLDELRTICTKPEFELITASRSPALDKLSATELKTHATNARKLVDKWLKLSRSQSRTESRKSGSPNLDSRSHAKHAALQEALAALEGRLASHTAEPTKPSKPTPAKRSAAHRATRQSTRNELHATKKTLNKTAKTAEKAVKAATAPAVASSAPVATKKSKPAATKGAKKKVATKAKLVKTAAKRTAKRATVAATTATAPAAPKRTVKTTAKPGIVVPTAASKATLSGRAKANRVALSNRTSNIAGHVSGKGKRVQGKRDSKGR